MKMRILKKEENMREGSIKDTCNLAEASFVSSVVPTRMTWVVERRVGVLYIASIKTCNPSPIV